MKIDHFAQLKECVEKADLLAVKQLLDSNNLADYSPSDLHSLLSFAVKQKNIELTLLLLSYLPLQKTAHLKDNALLRMTAKDGPIAIFNLLMDVENVKYNVHALDNVTLLYLVQRGELEWVRTFLSFPKVLEHVHAYHNEILLAAIKKGYTEIVLELLSLHKIRENLHAQDNVILKTAILFNHFDIADYLLKEKQIFLHLDSTSVAEIIQSAPLLPKPLINRMLHAIGKSSFDFSKTLTKPSSSDLQDYLRADVEIDNPYGLAKTIINVHRLFLANRKDSGEMDTLAFNSESAMDDKLLIKANKHFNNELQPALEEKFKQIASTFEDRLKKIEAEIQLFLLKKIKLTAISDNDTQLFDLLTQYCEDSTHPALLLERIRPLLTSNDISAQIAWRCLDQETPNTRWQNLFISPTGSVDGDTIVFTTRADRPESIRLKQATDIIRERLAYYYLLMKHEPNETIKATMEEDFVYYLAEVRRAHNLSYTEDDNPSCFPGTLTRLACIARKSSLAPYSIEKQDALEGLLVERIQKTFRKILTQPASRETYQSLFPSALSSEALCAHISDAITGIYQGNALDSLMNNFESNRGYAIPHYTEQHAIARQIFLKQILGKAFNPLEKTSFSALMSSIKQALTLLNKKWELNEEDEARIIWFMTSLSEPAVCESLGECYAQVFREKAEQETLGNLSTLTLEKESKAAVTKLTRWDQQISMLNQLAQRNPQQGSSLNQKIEKLKEHNNLFDLLYTHTALKEYSLQEVQNAVEILLEIPESDRLNSLINWKKALNKPTPSSNTASFNTLNSISSYSFFSHETSSNQINITEFDYYKKMLDSSAFLKNTLDTIIEVCQERYPNTEKKMNHPLDIIPNVI